MKRFRARMNGLRVHGRRLNDRRLKTEYSAKTTVLEHGGLFCGYQRNHLSTILGSGKPQSSGTAAAVIWKPVFRRTFAEA